MQETDIATSGGSAPPAEQRGRPKKRKRVALACDLCRERKIRCDGVKPICKPCEKRGEPPLRCLYTVVPQSARQISEQQ